MTKPPLSHYSPVFANKPWAGPNGYASYYFDPYKAAVVQRESGKRQWGRKRGIYTWEVERALNQELEDQAALVYKSLLRCRELDEEERLVWAQFLLSQFVRTPTFMKYEGSTRAIHGVDEEPAHDRVGCKECGDLAWITTRNWRLIVAHPRDYFIRSDNPVLLTGFLERAESCLFYPLSPRLCFAACSMPGTWDPRLARSTEASLTGQELERGEAHMLNFHFARAAGNTLMLSPDHNGELAESMYEAVLGLYPQPPFLLHLPDRSEMESAFESIRILMSITDNRQYPEWLPMELERSGGDPSDDPSTA